MQITSFICLVITSQPPSSATAKSSIFSPAFISVFIHTTQKNRKILLTTLLFVMQNLDKNHFKLLEPSSNVVKSRLCKSHKRDAAYLNPFYTSLKCQPSLPLNPQVPLWVRGRNRLTFRINFIWLI